MSLTDMQLAALREFEADLAAIPEDEVEDKLSEALGELQDLEAWVEALSARRAQLMEGNG